MLEVTKSAFLLFIILLEYLIITGSLKEQENEKQTNHWLDQLCIQLDHTKMDVTSGLLEWKILAKTPSSFGLKILSRTMLQYSVMGKTETWITIQELVWQYQWLNRDDLPWSFFNSCQQISLEQSALSLKNFQIEGLMIMIMRMMTLCFFVFEECMNNNNSLIIVNIVWGNVARGVQIIPLRVPWM